MYRAQQAARHLLNGQWNLLGLYFRLVLMMRPWLTWVLGGHVILNMALGLTNWDLLWVDAIIVVVLYALSRSRCMTSGQVADLRGLDPVALRQAMDCAAHLQTGESIAQQQTWWVSVFRDVDLYLQGDAFQTCEEELDYQIQLLKANLQLQDWLDNSPQMVSLFDHQFDEILTDMHDSHMEALAETHIHQLFGQGDGRPNGLPNGLPNNLSHHVRDAQDTAVEFENLVAGEFAGEFEHLVADNHDFDNAVV